MIDQKTQDEAMAFVKSELMHLLKCTTLDEEAHLIEAGMSSIMVMRLANKLRKFGIKIAFAKLIENPTLSGWRACVADAEMKGAPKKRPTAQAPGPFELTDVQMAYWVGRGDDQPLGGVGCHAYLELDGSEVDPTRLKGAWQRVQAHHPMLRARFLEGGKQEIMPAPYREDIDVYDFRTATQEAVRASLEALREQLSHRRLKVEVGEVAGVALALLPNGATRLFFDVDLLVADVMSLSLLIQDLAKAYRGESLGPVQTTTFRTVVEAAAKEPVDDAEAYWRAKLPSLPHEAPGLPLKRAPEALEATRFSRRKHVVSPEAWSAIGQKAAGYRVTPSMVLLTCYALVLERWCNQDTLLINMPLFNRDADDPQLQHMVADFTNLLLVDFKRARDERFVDTVARVHKTFLQNAAHSAYSGVRVQRDLFKAMGASGFAAPLVFACNIDYPLETPASEAVFGPIGYMVSQTPQVWLDFQTYVKDGALSLCWDAVDALFPEGLIDDMFDALVTLVTQLAVSDHWEIVFDVLPAAQAARHEKALADCLPLRTPEARLHDGFVKCALTTPDAVAVTDGVTGETITYATLYRKALAIAGTLVKRGVSRGHYVGVTLPRGVKQVEALLGVLFSGAAYVPIGTGQPADRRAKIVDQIGIDYVLTDSATCDTVAFSAKPVRIDALDGAPLEAPVTTQPADTAYVIMTSGSTGVPKGVEMCHSSAVNTLNDLNAKYGVTENDAVLMVSAIDFDLSVYDLFGVLAKGGNVVLLTEETYKDPRQWLKCIDRYRITLWNSVPILFDMLVTMAEGEERSLPLRVVMLSGDWIALDLPGRFYKRAPEDAVVVAMGGATEAAIWSNYLEVPKVVPSHWPSIPYGYPLDNQLYRVVDDLDRLCPDLVPGELWIGGVGVAKGYRGDSALSAKKFVTDVVPWYKTGDMGRFWRDGILEFLGRKDNQVKIKGHRIELGEIEEALQAVDGVKSAVVEAVGAGAADKRLVAYVEVPGGVSARAVTPTPIPALQGATDAFERAVDTACSAFLLEVFRAHGLFTDAAVYAEEAVMAKMAVAASKVPVVTLWLKRLVEQGVLQWRDGYQRNSEPVGETHPEISSVLKRLRPHVSEILCGTRQAATVFYDDTLQLTPSELMQHLPGAAERRRAFVAQIQGVMRQLGRGARVLELGTRDVALTAELSEIAASEGIEHVYGDTSVYFEAPLQTLSKPPHFEVLAPTSAPAAHRHRYDCIVAVDCLHRSINLHEAFKGLSDYLKPGGCVIGGEWPDRPLIQAATVALLEDGFIGIEDGRKAEGRVMPSPEDLEAALRSAAFHRIQMETSNGVRFFAARGAAASPVTVATLEAQVARQLPVYMMPAAFYLMERFPITANGKLDRKALSTVSARAGSKPKTQEALTPTEARVKALWAAVFKVDDIGADANYFALGGDSLVATRLLSAIEETFGVKIGIGAVFEKPVLRDFAAALDAKCAEGAPIEAAVTLKRDAANAYEPFPLTDVQYAYWIGRSGLYELGGVSTHCYFELETEEVLPEVLEAAWNRLIAHHDMMRAVILPTGTQKILKEVPAYKIAHTDLSDLSVAEAETALMAIRDKMSHQVIDVSTWPIFDIKWSQLSGGKGRLHISFDNIVFDGWSMFHLLKQWQTVYLDFKTPLKVPEIGFRDYVLGLEALKQSEAYERHRLYWCNRLDTLPSAPKLPVEEVTAKQTFTRRSAAFTPREWQALVAGAKAHQLTPAALLIAVYAEALRAYSSDEAFTLNLTRFDRVPLHPDVDALIGDFTSLTLLEATPGAAVSLAERAARLQKQLTEDLEHALYSAVEVQRALRRRSEGSGAVMPIVFTSGLGIDQWTDGKWPGKLVYNISQTPQVWIDCQVVEQNSGLLVSWDAVDALFPEGLVEEMFQAMIAALKTLANAERALDAPASELLPKGARKAAEPVPETVETLSVDVDGTRYLFAEVQGDPCCESLAASSSGEHGDNAADGLCAAVMAAVLNIESASTVTRETLLEQRGILPAYHSLVDKWLTHLTRCGVLEVQGARYVATDKDIASCSVPEELVAQLFETVPAAKALLTGAKTAAEVLADGSFKVTPEALAVYDAHREPFAEALTQAVGSALAHQPTPVCLELGTRLGAPTASLLPLVPKGGRYVYADGAVTHLETATKRFGTAEAFETLLFDLSSESVLTDALEATADVVVSENALHRARDLDRTLDNLSRLIKPGGQLIFREFTEDSPLLYTSVALLEEGYSQLADARRQTGNPLLRLDQWRAALARNGFKVLRTYAPEEAGAVLVVAQCTEAFAHRRKALERTLKAQHPEVIVLNRLPRCVEGSVDVERLRNAVPRRIATTPPQTASPAPETLMAQIESVWCEVLGGVPVGRQDNFFKSGGDSLKAVKLMNGLKQRHGIDMQLNWLFEAPTIEALARRMAEVCAEDATTDEGEL
ncbi:amino acid adenylation domain-containing protein [Fusibacter sp. JL298sf-3]